MSTKYNMPKPLDVNKLKRDLERLRKHTINMHDYLQTPQMLRIPKRALNFAMKRSKLRIKLLTQILEII